MKTDELVKLLDGRSYASICKKYEKTVDRKESRSDCVTLTGHGCLIKVCDDALELKSGETHIHQVETVTKLYRGTHKVRNVVVLSDSGMITLNAAEWCREQDINVTVIDPIGRILLSSGECSSNVALRRLQYSVVDNAGYLCHDLLQRKITAQLDMLKRHSELPGQPDAVSAIGDTIKWFELPEPPPWLLDIVRLRLIEASAAKHYFSAFIGMPILWKTSEIKHVPPHWKIIEERTSLLAPNGNGRHATNPFHAALNYAYALLESQVLQAIYVSGLDASCGYLHADKTGRMSLVFDVMELHRASVDHLVLQLFKTLQFERGMLIPSKTGELRMNPQLLSAKFLKYDNKRVCDGDDDPWEDVPRPRVWPAG